MPSASRAHGDSICRTGVFAAPVFFAGVFLAERRCGFLVVLRGVFEARDVVRREGEVFVATYTSMITGRITGFLWVTSKKYFLSTLRTFCCNAD